MASLTIPWIVHHRNFPQGSPSAVLQLWSESDLKVDPTDRQKQPRQAQEGEKRDPEKFPPIHHFLIIGITYYLYESNAFFRPQSIRHTFVLSIGERGFSSVGNLLLQLPSVFADLWKLFC